MRSISPRICALVFAAVLVIGQSTAFAQKKGGGGGTTAVYNIIDLRSPYHAADVNWSFAAADRISHPDPSTGAVYICGWYDRGDGTSRSCLWGVSAAQSVAVADLDGVLDARPRDVNSAGIVGGSANGRPALRLPNQSVVTLPTSGDIIGQVMGLSDPNENGEFLAVGFQQPYDPSTVIYQGMLWTVAGNGAVLNTQMLVTAQGISFEPYDVGNTGIMAGRARVAEQAPALAWFDPNGTLQLDYLPNPAPAAIRYWHDMQIDDAGNVVGRGAELVSGGVGNYPRAVVWPIDGPVASLSTLTGGTSTQGNGIALVNGSLQVAGSAFSNNAWYAFLYTQGRLSDLNRLSKGSQTWSLWHGAGVNRVGWICGQGRVGSGRSAQQHGYVLIPNAP
jgi:hypothetical protein